MGLVGPRYYYELKKQNKLSNLFFNTKRTYVDWKDLRNCEISFDDFNMSFDICLNKAKQVKIFLNYDQSNNIEVIRIDSLSAKSIYLNEKQKKFFIYTWNKAKGYTSGSPRIKYLIKVQGGVRTFNSDGFYLYEQSQDAKYKICDKDFFELLFQK